MTRLQRVRMRLMPQAHRAAAEAESRAWHLVCTASGNACSVWDLGGTRWKASGRASSFGRCAACRRLGAHRLEKRAPQGGRQ